MFTDFLSHYLANVAQEVSDRWQNETHLFLWIKLQISFNSVGNIWRNEGKRPSIKYITKM